MLARICKCLVITIFASLLSVLVSWIALIRVLNLNYIKVFNIKIFKQLITFIYRLLYPKSLLLCLLQCNSY